MFSRTNKYIYIYNLVNLLLICNFMRKRSTSRHSIILFRTFRSTQSSSAKNLPNSLFELATHIYIQSIRIQDTKQSLNTDAYNTHSHNYINNPDPGVACSNSKHCWKISCIYGFSLKMIVWIETSGIKWWNVY